jgi:hypothetical protein
MRPLFLLSHDCIPHVLYYPLLYYVLALFVLLSMNISGRLTEDASRIKRAIHRVNIAWAELCLRELIEASLNLLIPSGELHLICRPSVILLVLLLLLVLPLDQVLDCHKLCFVC